MKPTKCSKCGATMKSSDPKALDEFKALHKELHKTTAKTSKATTTATTKEDKSDNDGEPTE